MAHDDPLPIIQPTLDAEDEQDVSGTLYFWGYAVIAISWTLFILTVNMVFGLWKYIIEPLQWHENTTRLHEILYLVFSVLDDYIISFWGVYVVAWWWALYSWTGLKLFKQNKGIKS